MTLLNYLNKKEMQVVFIFIFGFVLMTSVKGQEQKESTNEKEIIDVTFCELVTNPEDFDKKTVRLRAIYYYNYKGDGYLYCFGCSAEGDIKNSFANDFHKVTKKSLLKKIKRTPTGRVLEVVVVGEFGKGPTIYHGIEFLYLETAKVLLKNNKYEDFKTLAPKTNCSCKVGEKSSKKEKITDKVKKEDN